MNKEDIVYIVSKKTGISYIAANETGDGVVLNYQ